MLFHFLFWINPSLPIFSGLKQAHMMVRLWGLLSFASLDTQQEMTWGSLNTVAFSGVQSLCVAGSGRPKQIPGAEHSARIGRGPEGLGFYKQHCWQLGVLWSSVCEFHFTLRRSVPVFLQLIRSCLELWIKLQKLMWKFIWLYLRNFPVSHFKTVKQ